MGIPDYQTLMLPVLRAFADGRRNVRECVPDLIQEFGLTEDEASELLPSGRVTVLANRAHWARSYLAKAGLLHSPARNVHILTPAGEQLLEKHLTRIDNNTLREYPEFEQWRNPSDLEDKFYDRTASRHEQLSAATPQERITEALKEIEADLSRDLLSTLRNSSPAFFEYAVIELLKAMGYGRNRENAGRVLGKSGDGGIDGIINEDALGLDAVYVQAKRYAEGQTIGRPLIQQFVGSLTGEGATKGVFVTTSTFSADAKDYARRVAQRIVLVDGERFTQLMIQYSVGVRTVERVERREIDANFFETEV